MGGGAPPAQYRRWHVTISSAQPQSLYGPSQKRWLWTKRATEPLPSVVMQSGTESHQP